MTNKTSDDPLHRRYIFGLIGGALGATLDAVAQSQGADIASMFRADRVKIGEPFETWAALGPGRVLAKARLVFRTADCVAIEVLEVVSFRKGPIPCEETLEREVSDALQAFAHHKLTLMIDWTTTHWGEHKRLRRYVR